MEKKKVRIITKEEFKQLVARKEAVRKYLHGKITKKELEDAGVRLAMPI